MKRFNKTAIALATAGALTFAIAPSAFADDTVTLQVGDLVYDADGNLVHAVGEDSDPLAVLKEGDTVYDKDSANVTDARRGTAGELPSTEVAPEDQIKEDIADALNLPSANGDRNALPTSLKQGDRVIDRNGVVQLAATEDGQEVVLQAGDKVVAADGRDVTSERGGKALTHEETIIAGVLGSVAALTLGGVLYNVVTDAQGNKVLVPADRADQTPTADDIANTDKLVTDYAAEIAAQGGQDAPADVQAANERGVDAATGNNAIAKGLIGLVIASVMGAAVFMYGRRQLV